MPAVIDWDKCDRCLTRNGMLCVENCLYEAISVQSEKPVVDEAQCDECKMCVDICPVQAIALK